ncbi:MAG: deoxyribodipyrimidine photo-lyase [Rickettsiales bacterium]|nr:deoxyribodipyrimidine photo-lyase [Rickettsiales bacterium]
MNHSLVWFRQDLRITDNPALKNAIENSKFTSAIYILDDEKKQKIRALGGASKWWLHYALQDLSNNLKENYNIDLIIRKGNPEEIIPEICAENNIEKLYYNRLYEPYYYKRDSEISDILSKQNIAVENFNSALLVEPWEVKNGSREFFKVYTHFYKACLKNFIPRNSIKKPKPQNKKFQKDIFSESLESLNLTPKKPNWAKGFYDYWQVSEGAAENRLYNFLENLVENYDEKRNFPDVENTSKLSPYLHFGQISPHQILDACELFKQKNPNSINGINKFISEIYWREFSYNLMFNFPSLPEKNFRAEFDNFPWEDNLENLKKWQKGKTGYPIIDAGMRELWHTGWMHNRVRMIVGSLLTKHLLTHWKYGEEWFWDCLVDADLANNSASWQWVSGSGADAAPYFRIFNPVMQGEKFDAYGVYVRKWIPELKHLPNEFIHKPWLASPLILKAAGVELGKNYPEPIIPMEKGRNKALEAYQKMRGK